MKKIQTFRETENLRHLYRNELDKVCFAHDAAYSYSKDLAQKTISKFKKKAYEIVRHPKYDEYQEALVSMVDKFFLTKKTGSGEYLEVK